MIGFYNYTVILTYVSLMTGIGGFFCAAKGRIDAALLCLLLCGFFDLFDGMIARTKKDRTETERHFGIQIDSLTDVVCFGALPAVIAYMTGLDAIWQMFILMLFALFGMIRLGYYNVTEQERQATTTERRSSYCGLPITTSAIIVPLVYAFRGAFPAQVFEIVLSIVMLLCGVAFVTPIRVCKPHGKSIVALLLFGAVLAVLCIIPHLHGAA